MNAAWLQTSNSTEKNADSKEQNPFEQSFSAKPNTLSAPRIVKEGNTGLVDVWDSDTSSYSYDSNSLNNGKVFILSNRKLKERERHIKQKKKYLDVYSVSDHQPTSEDSDDGFRAENPMTVSRKKKSYTIPFMFNSKLYTVPV